MQVRSFVDESFRQQSSAMGIYLFAAVTIASEDEDDIRTRLRRALPGRLPRFHWRDDRNEVRERALEVMRSTRLQGLTVYRLSVPRSSDERARQHALWNLVAEMRDRHVHDLVFEARERSQNQKDEKTLHQITKAGIAGPTFRYAFSRPLDEPLLWLPDYLAGACGTFLCDGNDRYVKSLPEALVEQRELPPLR
jgi:hypothetical protein